MNCRIQVAAEPCLQFFSYSQLTRTLYQNRAHFHLFYPNPKKIQDTTESNTGQIIPQHNQAQLIKAWLRHRLISGGLEPVLSHTEKSCIASYYKQLSTNNEIKNHTINTSFVSLGYIYFILLFVRGLLSIIRCDKILFPKYERIIPS